MLIQIATIVVAVAVSVAGAFDHEYTRYESLLSQSVTNGVVDYTKLSGDKPALSAIRKELETPDSEQFNTFSQKEQIAFLINAYNFYTLDLIVKNLPLKTGIRDIKAPWDKKFISLFGKSVSLNHIEHDLLRKDYQEPRVHFALVCASKGCPQLPAYPFTAANLDTQLDSAGKLFLTDSTRNLIEGKTIHLSQIFEWYGKDFDLTHKGGYREYVGKTLGISINDYKVKFLPYDWSLNGF